MHSVQISAPNLEVLNGAQLLANTLGIGNAGSVIIDVQDRILFSDNSAVFSNVGKTGRGDGGNIQISTNTVEILNGSQLIVSILGIGDAGNVIINARDRVLFNNGFASSNVGDINQPTVPIGNGGNVQISTPILEVLNGSQLIASTLGIGDAGNVIINASDQVLFSGNKTGAASSVGFVNQSTVPIGNGGNVQISTARLKVLNGAQVLVNTLGIGNAGNVIIDASDRVLFNNGDAFTSVGGIGQSTVPTGNGGNIQISTATLEVLNGSQLLANTFGIGNAGNVIINARDLILFSGTRSFASSNVTETGRGNGGEVQIFTNSLEVLDNAQLQASTSGVGNAGNVVINARDRVLFNNGFVLSSVEPEAQGNGGNVQISTNSLEVTNGSQLNASTLGTGKAGDVLIDARDRVFISGTSADGQSRSGIFVSSQTFDGAASNLSITTPQLRLDNGGILSARSAAVDGGNIILNIRDLLLMRRGSQISATAGLAQLSGNGGNITINAPRGFLVSAPNENNDITANAFSGSGGRITINAQGIYWFTPRSRADLERLLGSPPFEPFRLSTNDITASSTFGVSGVVAINTLGIDPSRGLQQLPVGLVDPSNQIDQKCAAGSGFRRSSFTVTGRGGLPENPLDPLQSGESVASWVEVGTENTQTSTLTPLPGSSTPPPSTPSLLVEADRVMVGKNGSVQLVASQPLAEPGRFWYLPSCASLKESDR